MHADEISNSSISEAQLRANRATAQKSTGPRTEQGKAKARFNARRHGQTGQSYCMSEEDEKAYKDFEIDILEDLKPLGAYEKQLAISITQDQWRLNRSRSVEFNLYANGHDRFAANTDAPSANMQAASTMADTYRADDNVFANIALYETRIHRMIAKNRKELNEMQAERKAVEARVRKEGIMLLELADFMGSTLDDAGFIIANDDKDFLYDGFVFSIAATRAIIKLDQQLRLAEDCAKKGWDRTKITLPRAA